MYRILTDECTAGVARGSEYVNPSRTHMILHFFVREFRVFLFCPLFCPVHGLWVLLLWYLFCSAFVINFRKNLLKKKLCFPVANVWWLICLSTSQNELHIFVRSTVKCVLVRSYTQPYVFIAIYGIATILHNIIVNVEHGCSFKYSLYWYLQCVKFYETSHLYSGFVFVLSSPSLHWSVVLTVWTQSQLMEFQ